MDDTLATTKLQEWYQSTHSTTDEANIEEDVELPGVDVAPNELEPQIEAPQDIVEIDDLDIPPLDPPPIINEPVTEEPVAAVPKEPAIANPAPDVANPEPSDQGLRRSTRTRIQPKRYQPSMSGNKYSYAVAQLMDDNVLYPEAHTFAQYDFYQMEPDVVASIMTQLSLKAGLNQWGDRAREAAHSEMKQLHLRDTFKPVHWRELNPLQRKTMLESHMFLKEKRSGKIKGCMVAGGNKQRDYISKEDASLPTVMTESILLTCIIDSQEDRDVAIIDIPNAFIQTRVDRRKGHGHHWMHGVLVDILLKIAPDVYKPFVHVDKKGVKQLLLKCQNAIYGMMLASLLYYKKFVNSLKSIGFETNLYDPCIANKIIQGSQMTICFHVDDCKLSHHNSSAVDDMITWLHQEYESIFEDGSGEMTVSRGKVHKYLGMTLDYSIKGRVSITMFDLC
jgi:hypothetical protein